MDSAMSIRTAVSKMSAIIHSMISERYLLNRPFQLAVRDNKTVNWSSSQEYTVSPTFANGTVTAKYTRMYNAANRHDSKS